MIRFPLPALSALAALAVPAVFAEAVTAQIQLLLNPRRTFLFTNQDAPLPPLIVDLGANNIVAGDWLELGTSGLYSPGYGMPEDHRSLIAVFSSSTTLLVHNLNRVVDAIAAGASYVSAPTWFAAMATDVPEDFFCSRQGWDDRIRVQVPAGAQYLFLGTHDVLYTDNSDNNLDFMAILTPIAPPTLPGTGEHLELASGVNGTTTLTPDVWPVSAGQTATFELRYPLGLIDGSPFVILFDLVPTAQTAVQLLPRFWLEPWALVMQTGVIPTNQIGWTATQSLLIPPGFAGLSLRCQAGALLPTARNGLFVATHAHRADLQ